MLPLLFCTLPSTSGTPLTSVMSPLPLFAALARATLDWRHVHVFQVDERLVPRGDPARNLESILPALVTAGPLPAANLHAMPIEAPDGCTTYEEALARIAGDPAVLDVVQLGLGKDGHTGSLFPGDAALAVLDRDVALSGEHAGHRRMTLTLPVLDRARAVVWFAPGAAKADAVAALAAGDRNGISGSLRRASTNSGLLRAAAARLPAA